MIRSNKSITYRIYTFVIGVLLIVAAFCATFLLRILQNIKIFPIMIHKYLLQLLLKLA